MLHINQITLREIHLPLRESFQTASGTETIRRALLIMLHDADGYTGWGECVAMEKPNYLPETIDIAWLTLKNWLGPRLLNQTLAGPDLVWPLLNADIRGHLMAKAGLEMASWELAARKQGIALAKLLGGTRTAVATGIAIGIQSSPKVLAQKAGEALAEGYQKIKIKIKPGADIDYVAAVREAIGPDAPLMVDANNAYTLDDLETLRRLDAFNLMMIEQPLAWNDYIRHAHLQRELQTPICLDESITGLQQAEDMVTLKSGRIINIKPGRVGGFLIAKAIHDLCRHHHIPVWCGGMLETGIGRAHNVALASLPHFTIPGDLSPSRRYWTRDIVTPEWTMDTNGMIQVPLEKAGMGVAPDMGFIEALTVRKEVLK